MKVMSDEKAKEFFIRHNPILSEGLLSWMHDEIAKLMQAYAEQVNQEKGEMLSLCSEANAEFVGEINDLKAENEKLNQQIERLRELRDEFVTAWNLGFIKMTPEIQERIKQLLNPSDDENS